MKRGFSIKREAFTLIELMFVLTMVTILSGMMMFYSNEVVASSKAAKIISDLTNLKKAVLAWYVDNLDAFQYGEGKLITGSGSNVSVQDMLNPAGNTQKANATIQSLKNYINGGVALNQANRNNNSNSWDYLAEGGYGIVDAGEEEERRMTWFVGYKFAPGEDAVKKRLKNKASSLGLIFSNSRPNENFSNVNDADKAKTVWMKVMGTAPIDGVEKTNRDRTGTQ